jgi:hypothetical protein
MASHHPLDRYKLVVVVAADIRQNVVKSLREWVFLLSGRGA